MNNQQGRDPQAAGIAVTGTVTRDQAAAVADLADRAERADGVAPLSEPVLLQLRQGGAAGARNLLASQSGRLAGYAYLAPAEQAAASAGAGEQARGGEVVVDPDFRRRGLGGALIRALAGQAAPAALRVWAHGDLPAAAAVASSAGLHRSRSLWQMRCPLADQPAEPRVAEGVTVRTFETGRDEQAWTRLNHAAFASHPEQGGWTVADLELREREPWFDPAGFFLAERAGTLVGFHWTKIHRHSPGAAEDAAIGEVYVVGVDPGEQGTGLGRALTLIGLRYLRDRGLGQVMLYVDESNKAAIRLYESLGFTRWSTDVMFSAG
ncbi:MAG TPA: mycothiol synthase [Streptosporangiaceae bacterium]